MSKELEALEEAKELTHRLITSGSWDKIEEQLNIVETALKEYETMKQTKLIVVDDKVSDEDLEKISNCRKMDTIILQPCKIVEETKKKLKAFEIIKKNVVKTSDEQLVIHNELDNSITFEFKANVKTQEDYDLLLEELS